MIVALQEPRPNLERHTPVARTDLELVRRPRPVHVGGREGGEPHDPGLAAEIRGNDRARFVLRIHFDDQPRRVLAVLAAPVRARQKMRSSSQERVDGAIALKRGLLV